MGQYGKYNAIINNNNYFNNKIFKPFYPDYVHQIKIIYKKVNESIVLTTLVRGKSIDITDDTVFAQIVA